VLFHRIIDSVSPDESERVTSCTSSRKVEDVFDQILLAPTTSQISGEGETYHGCVRVRVAREIIFREDRVSLLVRLTHKRECME